jgi:uncharacterized protein (TIGR02678 family)
MIGETDVERRRALRALLARPLLTAGENAEDYARVRRHAGWLRDWFLRFPAWRLELDRDVVRLRKTPADLLDDTRPAVDGTTRTPFSKRRYVVLCLALAALDGAERQTTLRRIARRIVEFVSSDQDLQAADMTFDTGNYDQRRDLIHAVRYLIEVGVLRTLDGDEQEFLKGNRSSDVLYEINRRVLALVLNVSKSPSAVDALRGGVSMLVEDGVEAGDSPGDHVRARLIRALLDDPILYFDDLNDEERSYFDRHRGYLLREIQEATGLVAEVRREGIAMVDDRGDLTDIRLPEETAEGHRALSLLRQLADRRPHQYGASIPVADLAEDNPAELPLTEDALTRLCALRLIRLTDAGVVPRAASARYVSRDEE